jgi:hypothetical protein
MNIPTPPKPKVKMFGLIRDKDGKPKIDGNPNDLNPAIKEMLSDDEKQELGIE